MKKSGAYASITCLRQNDPQHKIARAAGLGVSASPPPAPQPPMEALPGSNASAAASVSVVANSASLSDRCATARSTALRADSVLAACSNKSGRRDPAGAPSPPPFPTPPRFCSRLLGVRSTAEATSAFASRAISAARRHQVSGSASRSAVIWMFAASLVQALWNGMRHADWSVFTCETLPPDDEQFDCDLRSGLYAYRRIQADNDAYARVNASCTITIASTRSETVRRRAKGCRPRCQSGGPNRVERTR